MASGMGGEKSRRPGKARGAQGRGREGRGQEGTRAKVRRAEGAGTYRRRRAAIFRGCQSVFISL